MHTGPKKIKFTLKLKVTQKHIKKGLCSNANRCAVAQALLDTGLFKRVTVSRYGTTVRRYKKDGGGQMWSQMPQKGTDFIRNFDLEPDSVKPITLVLKYSGYAERG